MLSVCTVCAVPATSRTDSLFSLFLPSQIKKKCKGSDRSSCRTSPMAMGEAVAPEVVACMEGQVAVLALVRQRFWEKREKGSTLRAGQMFMLIF